MTATVLRRGSLRSGIDRARLHEAAGGHALMIDDGRTRADEAIFSHGRMPAHRGVGRDEGVSAHPAVMVDGCARPDDREGTDARTDVHDRARHDEGTLADGGGVSDIGARVNEGGCRVAPGAHTFAQGAPLPQMPVAHCHGDGVRRGRVCARYLAPGAEYVLAAVQVVDEAGKGVAALEGEVADHLAELARAVYEDLLPRDHFARANCRYLKQSAERGRMRRR